MEDQRACDHCGKMFAKKPSMSRKRWQQARFCSLQCNGAARAGKPSTSTGSFQKGMVPWNRGLLGYKAGPDNNRWMGDDAGYFALHSWLARNFSKTGCCDRCGEKKTTYWANLSGEYRRDRADWGEMCNPCHQRYDNQAWRDRTFCNACGSHDINFPTASRRAHK